MNKSSLRNPLFATMLIAAAYAPASSAIVKEQNVRDAMVKNTPSVTVDFSDLDIERGAGAEILYQRLRAAAKSVCGPVDGRDLTATQEARKCFDAALDAAVSRVNSERLQQIHNG
jgi:UrcA family protein